MFGDSLSAWDSVPLRIRISYFTAQHIWPPVAVLVHAASQPLSSVLLVEVRCFWPSTLRPLSSAAAPELMRRGGGAEVLKPQHPCLANPKRVQLVEGRLLGGRSGNPAGMTLNTARMHVERTSQVMNPGVSLKCHYYRKAASMQYVGDTCDFLSPSLSEI